jgi:hypothetical protein
MSISYDVMACLDALLVAAFGAAEFERRIAYAAQLG